MLLIFILYFFKLFNFFKIKIPAMYYFFNTYVHLRREEDEEEEEEVKPSRADTNGDDDEKGISASHHHSPPRLLSREVSHRFLRLSILLSFRFCLILFN